MNLAETAEFVPQVAMPSCECGFSFPEGDPDLNPADSKSLICPLCAMDENEPDELSTSLTTRFLDHPEPVENKRRPFIHDSMIGTRLGHFQVTKRLGSGGMARVYLANDIVLKRPVAVKLIQNRKYVSDEQMADALASEAVSQAQLNHPNIVSVYYVGKDKGLPFLAMEYVKGEPLETKLKRGPLPFNDITRWGRQIADALIHAKKFQIIHGDIKPANLLVDEFGNIKLSDFGLARRLDESQPTIRRIIGTPSQMAPELFKKQPTDEQSDLFALGVTLFRMTFGVQPYDLTGETVEEVRDSLAMSEIAFPSHWPESVPHEWQSILNKLLAKDRDDRFQSIEHFLNELNQKFPKDKVVANQPIQFVAGLIDNLVYVAMAIPFLLSAASMSDVQAKAAEFSIYNPIQFSDRLSINILLLIPFLYLIIASSFRRSLGEVVTQSRLFRAGSVLSISSYLKREVVRTLPLWCGMFAATLYGFSNLWIVGLVFALSSTLLYAVGKLFRKLARNNTNSLFHAESFVQAR